MLGDEPEEPVLEAGPEAREGLVARAIVALGGRLSGRSRAGPWLLANQREAERFVKFALVGVLGTAVDFSVLNLLILGLGMPKALANTFSFSAGALNNFSWNRVWTFPESRQRPLGRQFGQFFAVSLGGLAINQALFLSLDRWVFTGWGTLGYNLAKAIAVVVVLFWNFGANRIWTYRGL